MRLNWWRAGPTIALWSISNDFLPGYRRSGSGQAAHEEAPMGADDPVINRVHSASTATMGRSLNQVRNHQLVIDEPTHLGGPGEEITPADAFLAGVSACGVLLVQSRARDSGVRLDRVEADIEAVRHRQIGRASCREGGEALEIVD